MGDAKRRAKEIAAQKGRVDAWRAGLSPTEQVIARTAELLDERLVRGRDFTGGCYHLAFFMTHHLALQGIEVKPVIGWINDGLWEGVASHAWIEYEDKITDASLTRSENPDAVPTGALIVQGYPLRLGHATYRYLQNHDPEADRRRQWIGSRPDLADVFKYKEAQHQVMLKIAQERTFSEYLARAPAGGRYADIAALLK